MAGIKGVRKMAWFDDNNNPNATMGSAKYDSFLGNNHTKMGIMN